MRSEEKLEKTAEMGEHDGRREDEKSKQHLESEIEPIKSSESKSAFHSNL